MNLRALQIVVAISEHGSVTRAAGALHQSSSAVSHTLLTLEAELGVDLFHRLARGMALTDAGEAFVNAARRTLHEAEATRRSVDAVRGLVSGQVSVVTVMSFTVALADLLGEFWSRYPKVVARVFPPESTDGVVEVLRSGASDVGFTWAATVPDDLEVVPVWLDPSVVVVPEGHRLEGQRKVRIEDLENEPMVAPLATSIMRPMFEDLFLRHGVEPVVTAEAATNEMMLEMVRAGMGCTVIVASGAAPILGRGTVALDLADHPMNRILLVTRARQAPTPAVMALRQLAVARFSAASQQLPDAHIQVLPPARAG